jgi:hypothetical protein
MAPIDPLKTFWTLAGEGHTATATFWPHPLGVELRIVEAGELRRTRVYRDAEHAAEDARATRSRLHTRGWKIVADTTVT